MKVLALDPGPGVCGWVILQGGKLIASGVDTSTVVLGIVRDGGADILAIEMIASYGMPVGASIFETCIWIGRYIQVWEGSREPMLVYRKDVKLHLCGTPRAKDGNVRQALIDLFPATGGGAIPQVGTKAKPGPLHGISTHAWPALGVAITAVAQTATAVAQTKKSPATHPRAGADGGAVFNRLDLCSALQR